MIRKLKRQNQDKFGARRKLHQLQRKMKAEEAKLGITAPVIIRNGTRRKPDEEEPDSMSEEVFEEEMEQKFKRED